jgi:hypothetical protein
MLNVAAPLLQSRSSKNEKELKDPGFAPQPGQTFEETFEKVLCMCSQAPLFVQR